jgi:hypothetical protein
MIGAWLKAIFVVAEKEDEGIPGIKLCWGKFLPIFIRLLPIRLYELCTDNPKLNPSFADSVSSVTRVTVLSAAFDARVNLRLSVRYRRYLRLAT